jgi:hypothetical protein
MEKCMINDSENHVDDEIIIFGNHGCQGGKFRQVKADFFPKNLQQVHRKSDR